jgi:non-specific serine/threonine protein kinase
MIGESILHYKVLEEIGRGGMGVVYKAQDTKLKRTVAIKFLPRNIAANSEERERFRIEAQAAAALNHPKIATIYAIEEYDDELFLVMEYIEGRELRDIVAAENVPFEKILDHAIQVAEALQAAHEKNIVHRDIKSSNIMLTQRGQIKIMDFGLAKVAGDRHITKDRSTLGTIAYMSPEQARGEEVDHRTDIWSFGVVLYEMLTGELPFRGDYDQVVIYAILSEEPHALQLRGDVPEGANNIIQKLLQKDKEKRYQNFSEILSDLKALPVQTQTIRAREFHRRGQTPRVRPAYRSVIFAGLLALWALLTFKLFDNSSQKIESIAILPLVNLSGDAEQEYIADGMTEALITQLSKIEALRVISRQSVMRFKGSTEPVSEIAAKLKVEAVVEGSVILAGERIQITTNLIEAPGEYHLWSHDYERDFRDVLSLQKDVARAIAEEIALRLTPQDEERLGEAKSVDPEAFKLYLKGLQSYKLSTETSFRQAAGFFEGAIARDPGFGQAYAELFRTYSVLCYFGLEETKAREIAAVTTKRYSELPETQVALSVYHLFVEMNFDRAEAALQRAIELNPGSSEVHREYGLLLARLTDQYQKSQEEFDKALIINPLSPSIYAGIAETQLLLGQYVQASQTIRNAIELQLDFYSYKQTLGWAFAMQGLLEIGIEVLESSPPETIEGEIYALRTLGMLGYAYALAGRQQDALKQLALAVEKKQPISAAAISLGLNETEQSIHYLKLAFDTLPAANIPSFKIQLLSDPFWEPLETEPGFHTLMEEVASK